MADFTPFSWTCPHCRRPTTVTHNLYESGEKGFQVRSANGECQLLWKRITCPNPSCQKSEFVAQLWNAKSEYIRPSGYTKWSRTDLLGRGIVRFYPASAAETFPEYVPEAVRNDYEEACLISDLSPKSAATLARRALQGIVRDFWGGQGHTLKDEIDSVQSKCDPLIWKAMTAVREVGNIGAHMERDINLIVDVEPDEAELLIGLIETLVSETYVARYAREDQMRALINLAASKKEAKKSLEASLPADPEQ